MNHNTTDMETSNRTVVSPDLAALRQENKTLAHRLEVVENVVALAKEVLTLEEAAMFIGVKRSQLYKMTHKQAIPFYKPNGKLVYFERSELLKWLRSGASMSQEQINEKAKAIIQEMACR